jgi:two-component system CheB/CheR fusion protein
LEHLFDELPVFNDAAFVVIQHLSPDHKSMMSNLLARHTEMPVIVVENEMVLQTGRVYLIPPGKDMTVSGDQLRLSPKSPRGLSLPIDLFFTSLAESFGNRSIGIVLSGTGSDGTRGAVAINDAGGLLLAQDPESAKFDGMPRSVIATGLVDDVLPPKGLARRLLAHMHQAPIQAVVERTSESTGLLGGTALEEILHVLHHFGGVNFKEYKPATVLRRIERRMQVRHVREVEAYRHVLETDQGEVAALRREILIPVTNFFRDVPAFDTLATQAVDRIVEEHQEGQSIRVWVAGTSTGEEAYTVAILFAEAFERAKRWPSLKIFGTDVEQNYVDAASAGVFADSIAAELSPERLERFFLRKGNYYLVRNDLRQNVIFARHNLLEDPPFTRIDLLTCRNALIYLQGRAQEKIMRRFQYALAPSGYLFLGMSETLGPLARDFTAVSSKYKIYRVLRPGSLPLDAASGALARMVSEPRPRAAPGRRRVWNSDSASIEVGQSLLLRAYSPPAILLNEQRELIHVYGEAQRYLRFPEGNVSLDASRLLPAAFASVAAAIMHKALKDRAVICSEPLHFSGAEGTNESVRLVVRPVDDRSLTERYLLLSFEPGAEREPAVSTERLVDVFAENNERVESLEKELAATRDSLQATIEELETSNEELQATNEELMASNEELQSTNEELQSVNEELYTVNSEYQEKIDILNRLNADLDHMTRAACVPTLFVDSTFKLTRFTAEAMTLFKIRETDVGRPLDDFATLLDYPDLIADLQRTLADGTLIEREVHSKAGLSYLARFVPYVEQGRSEKGAVITFTNVTSLKDVKRLQDVLDSLPESIVVLDQQAIVTLANQRWRELAATAFDGPLQSNGGLGCEYSAILASGFKLSYEWTELVLRGVMQILGGGRRSFVIELPTRIPGDENWHRLHAAAVCWNGPGAVISHLNISAWVESHERPA